MRIRIHLTIFIIFLSINANTTVRHYTTLDGLPTNEVWQIVSLPNKQILAQSTGTFYIFNGKSFAPYPATKNALIN